MHLNKQKENRKIKNGVQVPSGRLRMIYLTGVYQTTPFW